MTKPPDTLDATVVETKTVVLNFVENLSPQCCHMARDGAELGAVVGIMTGAVALAEDVPRIFRVCPMCLGAVHYVLLSACNKLP